MNATELLGELFREIIRETERDAEFAARLVAVLRQGPAPPPTTARRRAGRRAPGLIDPFAIFAQGEEALRRALEGLTVDQLKDIVAEHGMDSAKLALKWRTPARLIDFIVRTVGDRSRKGNAFRE